MSKSKDKSKLKKTALKAMASGGLISLSVFSIMALRSVVAATATLPIIVRLVQAIEVTVATSLDFGTLAMSPDDPGRAMIDPGLNRLILDDRNALALAGGVPKVGRLVVRGAAFPVSISVEDTSVRLTNGISAVTVNDFNFVTTDGGTRVTITPQAGAGSFTIPVGATLLTKPGQTEGTYVGTTRVFANFQ
ncbi:MAG: DUF4402 domain-containing protein [Pseudomonadota bacterium]